MIKEKGQRYITKENYNINMVSRIAGLMNDNSKLSTSYIGRQNLLTITLKTKRIITDTSNRLNIN